MLHCIAAFWIPTTYQPDAETLTTIYSSAFMRHFYSDVEIDCFVRKWRKR